MKCNTLFVPKKLSPQKGNELKLPWPKPDVIITIKNWQSMLRGYGKKVKKIFLLSCQGQFGFGTK